MAQGAKPGEGGELPGQKGLSVDRQDALHHAGRRPHFAAAAPRHLFHRGFGGADSRFEKLQPQRARQREARRRGRRRHHRRRRRQGARGRGAHLRPRRRHRRVAAVLHQARRRAVGARRGRDAPDAGAEQSAQPHLRRDRRPDEDGPRRGRRRAARRGGIWFCHRAARGARLHHDARLPSEHLSRSAWPRRTRACARGSPATPITS